MSAFKWTNKRGDAALLLAAGYTQQQTADAVGVTERTIRRWASHADFDAEVDRLTLMTGIATRAERLKIAKQVIRQKVRDEGVETGRDVLDWLKFAQGETDGIKLDLAAILEAADQPMAGAGSDRLPPAQDGEDGDAG